MSRHSDSPPPNRERHPESFLARGGAWVIAQFIVMPAWLIGTPIGQTITPSIICRVVSASLILAGAGAGIAGVVALEGSRTPFPRPLADAKLVQRGVYSVIRHPLYASLIFLAFGWACLWQSAWGFAFACIQAVLLDGKARREEVWLREKFPGYGAYASRVRRLIPGVY